MIRWKSLALLLLLDLALARSVHPQAPSVTGTVTAILQARLAALDTAQRQFRAGQPGYAGSIWRLRQDGTFSQSPDVTLIILSADSTRWSAVAVHRALPGFRCFWTWDAGLGSGGGSCSGELDFLVLKSPEQSEFEHELAVSNTLNARCEERPATTESGRVVFEGTVGENGQFQLAGLSVAESPTFVLSYAGLYVITQCRFQPARLDGVVIPSQRRVPLTIRGQGQ
jgi:hypothetical protein